MYALLHLLRQLLVAERPHVFNLCEDVSTESCNPCGDLTVELPSVRREAAERIRAQIGPERMAALEALDMADELIDQTLLMEDPAMMGDDVLNIDHWEDLDIELEDYGGRGRISPLWRGKGVMFREVDGDYALDFHTAPRRQFVINLSGSVDIEVGDGTVRRIGPGGILLAEDTTGQGHISRAVSGEPRTCLFVPLDEPD